MAHTLESRARALAKMVKLRTEWLSVNGPCKKCGSAKSLQAHHRDPTTKVDHKVWSWRSERREIELAKCEVLCEKCHIALHAEATRKLHGGRAYYRGCRCEVCKGWKVAMNAKRYLPGGCRAPSSSSRQDTSLVSM